MNPNTQKLALVPLIDKIEGGEQLLVYEQTAARMLKLSLRYFRDIVDQALIPYRFHAGMSKRLFFIDDLRAYAKSLDPHYSNKKAM